MKKSVKESDNTVFSDAESREEDQFCDLDPTKICDNCFRCLETDSDYAAIEIDGIYMDDARLY